MGQPARGIVGMIVTMLVVSIVMGISVIGLFTGSSYASVAIPSHVTVLVHDQDEVSAPAANDSIQAFISPAAIVNKSRSIDTSDTSPVIKYSVIKDRENALG
jgi:hypothetical protein